MPAAGDLPGLCVAGNGLRRRHKKTTLAVASVLLKFHVPIEVIHPGFVQVMRGESPSHILQLMVIGLRGHSNGLHVDIVRHSATLSQIAGRAGRDDVVPARFAAARPRDQMVKRQFIFRSAIDAGKTIPKENVEAGESR